ncbi:hypothetical protein JY651_47760 [Pyxidicoccus parkwayensis]|uniref:Peptidase C39-like domain-containing protein n=1 Tax=Pyxidicoccus parkwayensis TaxID=2813578 RepID=A0ABX7P1U5_9BACT|nr:hypothetical protein [Pyxidicoccus parkwaysis]QSQ22718.1 hypothetical protein JY651_47760 [Pyxidicoccus parkwaysis]
MSVNLNVFTARVREGGTVRGPIQVQAPTEAARPAQSAPVKSAAETLAARRLQDSFEAAPVKRDDMPRLVVPQPPNATDAASLTPEGQPVNEAAEAQVQKGWNTDAAAVEQKTDSGCGEASLAFVSKASQGNEPPRAAEAQAFAEVKASAQASNAPQNAADKVDLADGATAEEMGAVLGEMGIDVTEGFTDYDANALSAALKRGEFGLALVDSNAILNSVLPKHKQRQEPGELHWVTIDGFNSGRNKKDASDDMYRVKDPVHGEYWVKAKDLQNAIDQGKKAHGGGGVLAVEKRDDVKTREERDSLAQKNRHHTHHFGKANGRGSRRLSVGESS